MATFYFYNAVDTTADWRTLSNWWENKECTQRADRLPAANDHIVVYSVIAQNSGAVPTVHSALIDATQTAAHPIPILYFIPEVWLSIELTVTGKATFRGVGAFLYTDDTGLSPVAKVNGTCVFENGGIYSDVPAPNAEAIVNGDAYFYGDGTNDDGLITGNLYVYGPESGSWGTVLGTTTFFPVPNTRVFRAANFPQRRREVVSDVDPTPINVQPGEMLYDEDENKLYAGLEDTTVVQVGGGNSFNQDLNTTNNVTFNDVQVNNTLLFKAYEDNTDPVTMSKINVGSNVSVLQIILGDDAETGNNVNAYYPAAGGGVVDYLSIVTTNGTVRHLFGSNGKYYTAGGVQPRMSYPGGGGGISGTVDTDATAVDIVDLLLTGDITLANPTNPTNGQTITWRIKQDNAGGRAVTLGNRFASPTTLTFSGQGGQMDILTAMYHAPRNSWDVIFFKAGY